MSGINFSQLRTATNPGLEGSGATDQIQVKAGTGISVTSGGVLVDTASTVTFSGASWTFGQGELDVSGSTFSGTDVPNADWITSQIATGVTWKFPVLAAVDEAGTSDVQLDSTGDAVRQAIAFYYDGQPIATDTFVIKDSTPTTETWTWQAGAETAAFQVQIGVDTDTSMDNLAAAISADSTLWDAVVVDNLNAINDGSGTSTAGKVLVIYRTVQAASKVDRIYGSVATPANAQYVSFNGEDDYTKTASANLPSADPAQNDFGPGTITASLSPGEAHLDLNADHQWVWDADGGTWTQISGTGSITAGDGLTKSGSTINLGNNGTGTFSGLTIGADSVAVALASAGAGTGGLEFVSNEIAVNPGDGILLDANGVGIDLAATSGLTLSGTSPNKELAAVGYDGIVVDSNGLNVDLEAAGSGTGGLEFKGTAPNREVAVNPGDGILLDANGVGIDLATTSGLTLSGTSPNKELAAVGYAGISVDANGINVDLEAAGAGTGGLTFTGTGATQEVAVDAGNGIELTAGGVAVDPATEVAGSRAAVYIAADGVGIDLDNSTLTHTSSTLQVKDSGIDTTQLAANAVTIAKLGIQFNEEEFAAASFTAGGAGAFINLALDALTGTQVDDFNECYRNGVADMTNVQSGGSPSGATQYRVYDTGTLGRLEIGADITATGNTYRVRYLSAL